MALSDDARKRLVIALTSPAVGSEVADAINEATNIDTADIDDLAVTTAKIDDLAVTTGKLAALSVTDAKLASDSVTTAKITDLNVTTDKLADGAVTDAKLDTGIDAAKLADGSVSNTEFQYISTLSSNAQTQISAKLTATQAANQADSVAADVPALVTDFNLLLGKLKAAGIMVDDA